MMARLSIIMDAAAFAAFLIIATVASSVLS